MTDFSLTVFASEVEHNADDSTNALQQTNPPLVWLKDLSSQYDYLDYNEVTFYVFDVSSAVFQQIFYGLCQKPAKKVKIKVIAQGSE